MSPYCWLPVRRTGPHRFPGAGVSWVQTAWSSHRHVCKKCLLDAAEALFPFSKEEAMVCFVKWWKIRLGWLLLSRCGDWVVAAKNCREWETLEFVWLAINLCVQWPWKTQGEVAVLWTGSITSPLKNGLRGHTFFCSHRHLQGLERMIKSPGFSSPCALFLRVSLMLTGRTDSRKAFEIGYRVF